MSELFEKPMCLISTNNDGHLEVVEDTVKCLEKIDSPLNVVAIAGLYRTGKSYLMNRLAGKSSGFNLGSSIESTTKGIWAWCRQHPTKPSQVLLLLDTEGLGDVKKGSIDHDNKIFTIATLLSSTLTYNMMSAFNQDAVEKLTFITMMSENLKVTSDSSADDLFDFIMPQFVLCLRDFNLELRIDGKEITEDEYLEDCLKTKEVETPADEKYNRPRECIKKYFTRRKVFTFDRPAGRNVMRRLDTAEDKDLNGDFILETAKFLSFVYECPAKMLHNKSPVTGSMLAKLLRVYVKAMEEGSVPCVEDAMMTMAKLENERHAANALDEYKTVLGQLQIPVFDKTDLLKLNFKYQRDILSKLNSKLIFDADNKIEKATETEMQALYDAFDKKNGDLLYEHCVGRIHEMHDKRIRTSIEKGKYAVAGGHALYKTDMQDLFDQYNKELNNVDFAERQRAQSDLQREVLSESEKIMTDDKSISEKDIQDSMAKQLETIKHDLLKTQEEEKKKFKEELENQGKQHKEEMETIRNEQRELEKANITKYNEEVLTRRDAQYDDLRRLAKLEAREELRKEDEERKKAEEREEQERQDRIRKENEERMKNAQCVLS